MSARARWALAYVVAVAGGLAALAASGAWGGFWIVAFLGGWTGLCIAFSFLWRWADETRAVLLRRRGYY